MEAELERCKPDKVLSIVKYLITGDLLSFVCSGSGFCVPPLLWQNNSILQYLLSSLLMLIRPECSPAVTALIDGASNECGMMSSIKSESSYVHHRYEWLP